MSSLCRGGAVPQHILRWAAMSHTVQQEDLDLGCLRLKGRTFCLHLLVLLCANIKALEAHQEHQPNIF